MIIRNEWYKAEILKYFPNIKLDLDNEISREDFFSLKRIVGKKHALENEAINKQYITDTGLVEGMVVTNGEITGAITTIASNGRLGIKGQRGAFNAKEYKEVK